VLTSPVSLPPRNAALYDMVAPAQPKTKGRPRQKCARMVSLSSLFTHATIQWEWIWVRPQGKETIVEVFQFNAIWYGAAGNDPLTVVLVRDPCGKYPDMAFFDTDRARRSPTGKQRAFLEAPTPPCANEKDPSLAQL
jgi:hypothetical protein